MSASFLPIRVALMVALLAGPGLTPQAAANGAAPAAAGSGVSRRMLRLLPAQAKVVTLHGDADTVVVGNPAFVTVQLSNPRTLILIPGALGTTSLTVMDGQGDVLYDAIVTVGVGRGSGMVTLHRACGATAAAPGGGGEGGGGDSGCVAIQTLDCQGGPCVPLAEPVAATPPSGGAIASGEDAPLPPGLILPQGLPGAGTAFPAFGGPPPASFTAPGAANPLGALSIPVPPLPPPVLGQ